MNQASARWLGQRLATLLVFCQSARRPGHRWPVARLNNGKSKAARFCPSHRSGVCQVELLRPRLREELLDRFRLLFWLGGTAGDWQPEKRQEQERNRGCDAPRPFYQIIRQIGHGLAALPLNGELLAPDLIRQDSLKKRARRPDRFFIDLYAISYV